MGILSSTKIDTTSYVTGETPIVCDANLPNSLLVNRPADTPVNGWANESLLFTGNTLTGDVYLEFTLANFSGNSAQMVGLDTVSSSESWQDLEYAIYVFVSNGTSLFRVYQSGVATFTGTALSIGDVLRIEKNGSTITYLNNGAVQYTSLVPSNTDLQVGSSFFVSAFFNASIEFTDISFCEF